MSAGSPCAGLCQERVEDFRSNDLFRIVRPLIVLVALIDIFHLIVINVDWIVAVVVVVDVALEFFDSCSRLSAGGSSRRFGLGAIVVDEEGAAAKSVKREAGFSKFPGEAPFTMTFLRMGASVIGETVQARERVVRVLGDKTGAVAAAVFAFFAVASHAVVDGKRKSWRGKTADGRTREETESRRCSKEEEEVAIWHGIHVRKRPQNVRDSSENVHRRHVEGVSPIVKPQSGKNCCCLFAFSNVWVIHAIWFDFLGIRTEVK